ncbi:MAG: alkaline phosphatase family protein [Tepidisphaeraceae bacterium]
MRRTIVINVVGLSPRLIGQQTPAILALSKRGSIAGVVPSLPAVTASVQATYLTGTSPDEHGVVGNGWFDRDNAEVRFWRQADALVQRPRVWDILRQYDSSATTANSFWWNAMYTSADVTLTPRPMYPADGRKLPDVWTHPPELREQFQSKLGQFPLFKFWGPMTSVASTKWIVDAAIEVERRFKPTLHLVYLPHLDYVLQRVGPNSPEVAADLREIDAEVARLVSMADAAGLGILLLSEYGIVEVDQPVHLNRVLREHGYLTFRNEFGRELLDAAACRAFAVADHQIAHVYVRDKNEIPAVLEIVKNTPGVASAVAGEDRASLRLNHDRAGDIIALATPRAWFTYYYWQDDAKAPDFARTVDIHRKPGYDPAELFLDPAKPMIKARIAAKLAARKLGQRALLDVIPLDATLVRGSHGLIAEDPLDRPVLISSEPELLDRPSYEATDVLGIILKHVGFA